MISILHQHWITRFKHRVPQGWKEGTKIVSSSVLGCWVLCGTAVIKPPPISFLDPTSECTLKLCSPVYTLILLTVSLLAQNQKEWTSYTTTAYEMTLVSIRYTLYLLLLWLLLIYLCTGHTHTRNKCIKITLYCIYTERGDVCYPSVGCWFLKSVHKKFINVTWLKTRMCSLELRRSVISTTIHPTMNLHSPTVLYLYGTSLSRVLLLSNWLYCTLDYVNYRMHD